ncbi:MAG TPA: Gfo/Idh/MocA family oxidoreductase [Chloroflexota bacterium]
MSRVRIGLVGCGTIAGVMHLPGIEQMREIGKAELVAVCDAVPEKAKAAAERYGVPEHFGHVEDMLARADFDLLVNNTPIPSHFEVTLAALKGGRHVYTQKPMATTVDETTILIDEAKERRLKLGVAPEHPVRPVVRRLRELVEEGAIGKVTFARVQSSHDGPETHDVPRDSTWFYKPGSSPILDMGVHGLSRITAILGPIRQLACMSGRSRQVRTTTAGPFTGKQIEVEIDDNSLLMLDFGEARFCFLDATYCVPATQGPRTEIHGADGTIAEVGVPGRANQTRLQLYRAEDKEWREIPVEPAPPCRDLGVLHMVDSLREGTPLVLTGEHGRHLVEVMAKAPEAARTGRTIPIETTF